nr:protein 119 [synthetic construct]
MSFHADSDLFSDVCYCDAWTIKLGSNSEKHAIAAIDIFAIIVSVLPLMYYMYSSWKSTCGWEEVYVCSIELTKCFISLFRSYEAPGVLYLSTGNTLYWLRYGEWLLTCPVILIHLSNITGLKDAYSKRTMKLLVSDIGTIVFGVSSAASTGPLKIFFFVLGLIYGANTFFHAAKVYVESYHMVPRGTCKLLVRLMAMVYFVSWSMFPIFFVLGPEGFGVLSHLGSDIAHTWIDLMSKNLWGFIGHLLRQKIHYHILKHGDIRKTTKVNIAGEEVNVETYVEEEDEETV